MEKEKTFIKISNKDVWNEVKSIKDHLDKIDIVMNNKMDKIDLMFTNHLDHHKKFENNIKFYIPIVISIIFAILQFIFYLLKK